MDATLSTAALAAVETVINQALSLDPGTRHGLARLQGKVLAVHAQGPDFSVYLVPNEQGLELFHHWEGDVTAELTGPASALLGLLRKDTTSLAGTDLEVKGNIAFLQDLQQLGQQLDLDWEELFTRALGDVAGHQVAEGLRAGHQWAKARAATAERLLGEFITEEARLSPSRHELDDFYRQVDDLTESVDRAQARLQWLRQRLAARNPKE
ncbi:ubiquinone biosynthesis accessory factor UbiJ [Marinimicrobium alkaliphilum]|uniref:ubiquinone biosynthesis accessory factor UbiJ n=1 Tax=Marinimicrobium alkaliphilum TaxID=2202654 RepID=UPI000DBA3DEA|nr:SCP2 sterol-binding domain-containing protein [Marinimicrobium alkaliphilum]